MENPSLPSHQRKRRLEDLILLALRCLVMAMAIMAIANPRMKGLPFLASTLSDPGQGSEAIVLELDDSPSVSLRNSDGRQQVFPKILSSIASTLERGVNRRVAVEMTSGRRIGFTDSGLIGERLKSVSPKVTYSSGDRTVALRHAVSELREANEDRKILILASDLFLNEAEGNGQALQDRWHAALKELERPSADRPAFICIDCSGQLKNQTAIRVLEPVSYTGEASGRAFLAGQPFSVRLILTHTTGDQPRHVHIQSGFLPRERQGTDPWAPLADRQTVIEKRIAFGAPQEIEIKFPAQAAKEGALWFRAELDLPDELPFDDAVEILIPIHSRPVVTLWDLRESERGEGLQRDEILESLEIALNPLGRSISSRVGMVQRIERKQTPAMDSQSIIALYSPEQLNLSPAQRAALEEIIRNGGHLLWVPDLSNAEAATASPVDSNLVPVLLPRSITRLQTASKAPSGEQSGWRLRLTAPRHPLLRPFADGRNGNLTGLPFQCRLQLQIRRSRPDRLPDPALKTEEVLARFQDGQPAMILKRLGEGVILQLGMGMETSKGIAQSVAWPIFCSEFIEWSSLDELGPLWTHPLPTALASTPSWPLRPSTRGRTYELAGPFSFLKTTAAWEQKSVDAVPDRWKISALAGDEKLDLPRLARPGHYHLSHDSEGSQRWLNSRISALESAPDRLPKGTLQEVSQACKISGGQLIRDARDLESALLAVQPGSSMAAWLWIIFALGMGMELAILGFRKRSG